jgi:hypothetical protein
MNLRVEVSCESSFSRRYAYTYLVLSSFPRRYTYRYTSPSVWYENFSPTKGATEISSLGVLIHNILSRTDDNEGTNTLTMPEISRDEVLVLLDQESTVYRTCDYLGAKTAGSLAASSPREYVVTQNGVKKRRLLPASSNHHGDDAANNEATKNKITMNPDWRLKMIEWAYKGEKHEDFFVFLVPRNTM